MTSTNATFETQRTEAEILRLMAAELEGTITAAGEQKAMAERNARAITAGDNPERYSALAAGMAGRIAQLKARREALLAGARALEVQP